MADSPCLSDSCNGGTSGISAGIPFFGGVETTSYKILLVLHIVSIIAAFGPTFIFPTLLKLATKFPGDIGAKLSDVPYVINRKVFLPALILGALFGVALVVDSSDVYTMQKPWVSGAFTIVIALGLVSWFVLRPAQQRFSAAIGKEGSDGETLRKARAAIAASTGVVHLGLVATIALMVWKPGQ